MPLSTPLNQIRIVLVRTTHPGNIGAAARAMKNMGLSQLYLVQPQTFPHQEATARATGADDLLAQAVVVNDVVTAVEGCGLVIGTSARVRALPWPALPLEECAKQALIVAQQMPMAILFGPERTGLTNADLQLCHYLLQIPTNPEFAALNLASAVLLVCYELSRAMSNVDINTATLPDYATAEEIAHFYAHLEQILIELEFLNPQQPKHLMRRLQRLFNRAKLEKQELNILRGILTAVQRKSE
ncbi:MAG: RNA methyltransferase [Coxiellaceae bacterium]|nr:MAG: RNA methyltransferase [Coxiellaceae bacterium]